MTQKTLFGSAAKTEPVVTKVKKTIKKAKNTKIEAPAVSVPSQAEVYKKYKQAESREEIVKRYIESYCWRIDNCYSYIVEPSVYNRCCETLECVLDNKTYNKEIVDTLKRIIESANINRMQMLYVYASMNAVLFNYLNEVYPLLNTDMIFTVVDRAYAELIYYGE